MEYFLKMDVFVYAFFVLISEATRLLFFYNFDDVLLWPLVTGRWFEIISLFYIEVIHKKGQMHEKCFFLMSRWPNCGYFFITFFLCYICQRVYISLILISLISYFIVLFILNIKNNYVISFIIDRPSPKLVLIILQLCRVALPLMSTDDCEYLELPSWGQHMHSTHWSNADSISDPPAKIVSLLLAKLGDFLVPGKYYTA